MYISFSIYLKFRNTGHSTIWYHSFGVNQSTSLSRIKSH